MIDAKIYVLNTLIAGLEIINAIKNKVKIHAIIGLNSCSENIDFISGYIDLKPYCIENDIEYLTVSSYKLNSDEDILLLKSLEIDYLLVLGWQRLIPKWLIEHVNIACLGAHGSPWGIQNGRGRSPMNWGLILGSKSFEISLFKIDEGIDSGKILKSDSFSITDFDDINTLYMKSAILLSEIIVEVVKNYDKYQLIAIEQNEISCLYLPQRIPNDGMIDWNRDSNQIYNFVRAQTKPYPGAFTIINGKQLFIWDAIPFDYFDSNNEYPAGTVVHKYTSNGYFLVKCRNSLLLVKNYTGSNVEMGNLLISANFKIQITEIIERHYRKFPKLIINDEIIKLTLSNE